MGYEMNINTKNVHTRYSWLTETDLWKTLLAWMMMGIKHEFQFVPFMFQF